MAKEKVEKTATEQNLVKTNDNFDPYEIIKSKKAQKWMGLQVVKVFLGIPIVPGK